MTQKPDNRLYRSKQFENGCIIHAQIDKNSKPSRTDP